MEQTELKSRHNIGLNMLTLKKRCGTALHSELS